jgi:hypothetical protein
MRHNLGPHLLILERSSRGVIILLKLADRGVPLQKCVPRPSKFFTRNLDLRFCCLMSGTLLAELTLHYR